MREDVDRSSPRNLVLVFVLAFGWSWALWGPRVLLAQGMIDTLPRLPDVAAFGPTVAGIVMLYLEGGLAGLRRLVHRTIDVGFSLRWLLVALLLFPVLTGVSLAIATTQGATPTFPWAGELIVLPAAFVFVLLLGGPIQEEFGWRGYALDPLQSRFGATRGSLVLGVLWSLWHLPLFFIPTQTIYYQRPFWGLLLSVMMLSVLMTWVYNNVGGSLLVMVLMHTAFNWSQGMFPVLQTDLGSVLFVAGMVVFTAVVIVGWGPRELVRERPNGDLDRHEADGIGRY
jgi:hypothetical protein